MNSNFLDKIQFSDGTNTRSLVSGFLNRLNKFLTKNPKVEDVFFTIQFHDRSEVVRKLKEKGDKYVYVPKSKVFIKKVHLVTEIEEVKEQVVLHSDNTVNIRKTEILKASKEHKPRIEKHVEDKVVDLSENEIIAQRVHTFERVITCIPENCQIKTLTQISQTIDEDECPFCGEISKKRDEVKSEDCESCLSLKNELTKSKELVTSLLKDKEESGRLLESQKYMIKKMEDERRSENRGKQQGQKNLNITPISEDEKEAPNIKKYNSGLLDFSELSENEQVYIRNQTAKQLGIYIDSDEEESIDGSVYSEDSAVFD